MSPKPEEINQWNSELESLDAVGRIRWTWDRFGSGLISSTSFGLQSAVMIHLVRMVSPDIPIVFVDTGYLFPGTYQYALDLQKKLDFEALIFSARKSPAFQESEHGKLWEQGSEGMKKYNLINKKEPMDRAIKQLKVSAWLAGLAPESILNPGRPAFYRSPKWSLQNLSNPRLERSGYLSVFAEE